MGISYTNQHHDDDLTLQSASNQKRQKILFYCQSSLGIGHVMRSVRLIETLCHSFHITFATGADLIHRLRLPEGVTALPLAPIVTDKEFSQLQSTTPDLSVEQALAQRATVLLNAVEALHPDFLIVELFPFGRGAFAGELKPLLKQSHRLGAVNVCSVRDILVHKKNKNDYETKVTRRIEQYFDVLLIHGDRDFIPFNQSFSALDKLTIEHHYTGYVTPRVTHSPASRYNNAIITSIGGGRFGHELAFAVVAAAKLLQFEIPNKFFLSTGPFCPPEIQQELQALSIELSNLEITDYISDLHEQLAVCALSISMGGYNTTMDVLAGDVPALMYPCQNNGGMDQLTRLTKLAELHVIEILSQDELVPVVLAKKIFGALTKQRTKHVIKLDGALNTAHILQTISERTSTLIMGA